MAQARRRTRTKDVPRDLDQAVYDLGIRVKSSTNNEIVAWCPGHLQRKGREERDPSFAVNRETGLFNCFSCGYKGTFLTLVNDVLYKGVGLFDAARWIRTYGIDLTKAREVLAPTDVEAPEVQSAPEVEEASLAFFVDPPRWALDKRGISVAACHRYGVLWDADRDYWIIPIRDVTGTLIGWQVKEEGGRYFRNRPRGVPKSKTLFGLQQFEVGTVAVLVESPLDVLHLYTLGWEGGVSSYGAAVTDDQMDLLLAVTDECIIALDNDDAGGKNAEALRAGVVERGRITRKPWAPRFVGGMRFFAYARRTDAKDIGDMEAGEIEYGFEHAQHWTVARPGPRDPATAELPAPGRSSHARPWAQPRIHPAGRRKDGRRHLRDRGTA